MDEKKGDAAQEHPVQDAVSEAKEKLNDAGEKVSETAEHAGKVIGEKTEAAKEKMGEVADKVSTEMGKKSNQKKMVIAGVAAVAVVAVVVLGCILIPKMFGTDYKESARVAGELETVLDDAYDGYSAVCYDAFSGAADESVSVEDYTKKVDACKEKLAEGRKLASELGKTSGVKNDADIKAKYEAFEEDAKVALPESDELDKTMNLYTSMHEFIVKLDEFEPDMSEDEIKNTANLLINTGNEALVKFGEGWRDRMIEVVRLYAKYEDTGDYTIVTQMMKKVEEMEDWANSSDVLTDDELGELDSDKVNDMLQKFIELKAAIDKKA